jgi:hypothetical protein
MMDDWVVLTEPGGYAGSWGTRFSGFETEGIKVEASVNARHPDAEAAVIRLIREFLVLHPEYGEFTMDRVTKPTARKHGNRTSVDAYYFAETKGFEKWTADRAAGRRI